jgi:predicted RNA-binding Zn-ribbon protein involved in translation (DUF1610 family)
MRTHLPCPDCGKEFEPKEILENSTISWPGLNWIYFRCPRCEKNTHILVEDGRICTVDFIGAPGPDWKVNTPMLDKRITTRMDPSYAHVWLDGVHYEFEAKQ